MRDGVVKSGCTFHCSIRGYSTAMRVESFRALPTTHRHVANIRRGYSESAAILSLILSTPEGTLVDRDNSAATRSAVSRSGEWREAA
jgi:hypothetical protein